MTVIIQRYGSGDLAVKARLEKSRKAFWALTGFVWNVRQISLSTRLSVDRAWCFIGSSVWSGGALLFLYFPEPRQLSAMELLLAGFLGRRVHRRSMSKEHLDAKAIHDGTAPPRERAKSLKSSQCA